MRTGSRRILRTGMVAALGYAAWRAWRARVPEPGRDIAWETGPFPFPPVPRPVAARVDPPSTEPVAGTCPATHPVKAKLASGIYHVPGSANYERTNPDRCYVDEAAARADGLRAAKR